MIIKSNLEVDPFQNSGYLSGKFTLINLIFGFFFKSKLTTYQYFLFLKFYTGSPLRTNPGLAGHQRDLP
jgi:hypothetical protein